MIALVAGLNFWTLEVKADQASSGGTVTNVLPVASSVTIAGTSVTLTEAATTTVTATFTVVDNNGCEDIDSHGSLDTIAVLYRTNVANGADCTPDAENCYSMNCTSDSDCVGGGSDLDDTFTCTVDVQFYADATDNGASYSATTWSATATPRDNAGTDGTTHVDTIEMDTTTALDVTATITYTELALGADSGTTDQTTIVTNTGNDNPIDIQVDGYGTTSGDGNGKAMDCTIGTFDIGYERYATTSSTDWSIKTQLTDTAAPISDFNLAKGDASTKDVYWGLGFPATGVGGSCTGKVNFTAVSE